MRFNFFCPCGGSNYIGRDKIIYIEKDTITCPKCNKKNEVYFHPENNEMSYLSLNGIKYLSEEAKYVSKKNR
jgi:hypothetical protein